MAIIRWRLHHPWAVLAPKYLYIMKYRMFLNDGTQPGPGVYLGEARNSMKGQQTLGITNSYTMLRLDKLSTYHI